MPSSLKERLFRKPDPPRRVQYSSLRALVVDDEYHLLELVCRMLMVLGIRTDSANSAKAAMHCLEQNKYDLLITDYQMPELDGFSLASWLKRQANHTKIVIMTGRNPIDMQGLMDSGIVDDWLFKPFTMSMLGVILDKLFNLNELRAQTPSHYQPPCSGTRGN